MRAYNRKDPLTFHNKVVEDGYPIGAYAAFEALLCIGEAQPTRGRFASEKLLRLLLDEPAQNVKTGLGRWVTYLLDHGDLSRHADGVLEIVHWDGWQEGDVTVKERMARLRRKPRDGADRTTRDADHRNGRGETVTQQTVNNPSRVSKTPSGVSGKHSPPTPAERGPNGTPRTNGTNPRAVIEKQRRQERERLDAIRLAYLEGRLNGDQEAELRRSGGWPGAAA